MSITNIKSWPLNQKVFKENIDYSIFESILDTLDWISPKFVSREQFNNKKWDILNDKFWKKYTLFLPSDLKIHELPSIIYKINKLSFPGQVPEYASINELKIKITLAIDLLLSELKTKKTDKQKIKKAIKNYIRLYSQMFPDEDASLLNNADYRKSIMETKNRKKHEKFAKKLQQIKTKENLSDLQEELDKLLSTEIWIHFEESLYERWLNKLSMWLMSITQAELDNIRKNNSNPKDKTVERIDKDKLDKKEQLLRSKIWIEQFKKELDNIRAIWNIEEIAKKELEITNIILEILHEFPYQLTEKNYWYQPK